MEIGDLQNQLVAILGFGQEGQATARYLLKHGVKPVLFDQRPWEKWDEKQKTEIRNLKLDFIFGPDCLKELAGFKAAFRSPGWKLSDPDLVKWSIKGLVVTSQTKWFFDHCPAKIIGVTGTKGKGTTSSLIYEILKDDVPAKQQTFLTGNIGKDQALDFLDDLSGEDRIVYELSSFQLQDLDKSPHVGVVLMVTQEHLDYHENTEEYITAKEAIVKFQAADDFAVINADFPSSVRIGKLGKGKKIYFSRQRILTEGCFVDNGEIVVKNIGKVDFKFPLFRRDSKGRLVPNLQLRGDHNLENVCAAISIAAALGVPEDVIGRAVNKFKGLEHRLEFVSEKNGIKFYNDSFSSTPETAIAAIGSFTEPEIIILGGSSKNSNFKELGKTIAGRSNIKAIILIGHEAPAIGLAIAQYGPFRGKITTGSSSMAEIFGQIKTVAASGDIVLLSPACASFDMFRNYKDRGEQFKKMALQF